MLEFDLPFRVGAKRVAALRLALGLEGEHFARVIEDGGGRVLFRARPFCIGQRTERRRFFPDPDIARNHESLLERNEELRLFGEFDRQHFAARPPVGRDFLQSLKPADAVLEMDHQFAFVEIAEIDLGAMRAEFRGPLQAAAAVGRRAAEKLRGREHDEIGRRETETARERAFEQIDSA